jgi:hypothetical protein
MLKLLNKLASVETKIILKNIVETPEDFDPFRDNHQGEKWSWIIQYGTFSLIDRALLKLNLRKIRISQTKSRIYIQHLG